MHKNSKNLMGLSKKLWRILAASITYKPPKYQQRQLSMGTTFKPPPPLTNLSGKKNKAASTMQTPDGVKNVYTKVPNANQSINKAATYYQ